VTSSPSLTKRDDSAGPLLDVHRLSTYFRTPRGLLRAVDDVSFSVDVGETLAVVGESGSGKSALVRTLMRLVPRSAVVPSDTHIYFEGRDLRTLPRDEYRHFWGTQMAMIFQDPLTSLNPVRRIGRQMMDPMRYHLRLSRDDAKARAINLLGQVGISAPERRLKQYPHELSGGMRQRVMIAIALSCNPKLLIADEPTTALDVTVQKQILDLLAELQRETRMAMILITHDLGVVAGRTNRIAVMYAGRFVEVGETRRLFRDIRHPYTESLLLSIPRLSNPSHTRLEAITGRPPDLTNPPTGCRFTPRCPYAQPSCAEEEPALLAPPGESHAYRCWFPVGTEAGRKALTANLAAHVPQTEAAVGHDPVLVAQVTGGSDAVYPEGVG
jgi:peptide/nickel transport system ATP-binding protein